MARKKTSCRKTKSMYHFLKRGFNAGLFYDVHDHLTMATNTCVHTYTGTSHFFRFVCSYWRDSDNYEFFALALHYPSTSKEFYGQTAKRFYHLLRKSKQYA